MKITSCFLCLFCSTALLSQIPVFPGAQGFGTTITTGGRGGQVIYVTNLDCDGPGSLNQALATPGPKYILFKVSGIIDCAAWVEWGDCYVAGQTSPGGITVRGIYIDDWYDPNGGAQNIVLRHLNSRPNTEDIRPATGWVLDDGLRLDGASRVVVDHCTFANAIDEQVQISRSNNITIQHCMLAESVGDHYMFGGMLLNYSAEGHHKDSISIHHNIWNRLGGRMPEITCEQSGEAPNDVSCLQHPLRLELSNNVFWDQQIETYYNSGFYTSGQEEHGLQLHANIVNNRSVVRSTYCNAMFRILMLNFADNILFANGNTMSRYPTYHDYDLFYCCNDFCDANNNPNTEMGLAQRRVARFPFPNIDYTPTAQLVTTVAATVGAFNCYSAGHRDQMNRRLLQPLQSQLIDNHPIDGTDYFHDAYSLDFVSPPAAPIDTDGDGMPNDWEIAEGLNPNLADHNGTQRSVALTGIAGYTNLECYLNQLSDQLVHGNCGAVATLEPSAGYPAASVNFDGATHSLQVSIAGGFGPTGPWQVSVHNTTGVLLCKAVLQTPEGIVPIPTCPAGVYFVTLSQGNIVETKRVYIP
jgi:hypothetical protein